jgi:hypothetical protein
MSSPEPKFKICKICRCDFQIWSSLQQVCSPECAIKLIEQKARKKFERITREKKSEYRANNRPYQMKKAQDACNAYIRLRDGKRCISCGTEKPDVQYCAGHFKSIGSHPELRFHPMNISVQCNRNCNQGLSGNISKYRPNLIKKIGRKNVLWLEGEQHPQNLTLDDIKAVTVHFKEQLAMLKNG